MKTISLTIPTSWREWKEYIRERASRRRRHNIMVLRRFASAIEQEVMNNYWKGDISDAMKRHVFDSNFQHAKMYMLFQKIKKEIR